MLTSDCPYCHVPRGHKLYFQNINFFMCFCSQKQKGTFPMLFFCYFTIDQMNHPFFIHFHFGKGTWMLPFHQVFAQAHLKFQRGWALKNWWNISSFWVWWSWVLTYPIVCLTFILVIFFLFFFEFFFIQLLSVRVCAFYP